MEKLLFATGGIRLAAMDKRLGACQRTVKRLSLMLGILTVTLTCAAARQPILVELSSYGFPHGKIDIPEGVFWISAERVALYFDHGEVVDSPSQDSHRRLHHFLVLIVSKDGRVLSQQTLDGFPKALDIMPGPDGGLIVGRAGSLSFYDADLQLKRSITLSPQVTAISFDRRWNQLLIATVDKTSRSQSISLLNGDTLENTGHFTVPERGVMVSGHRELAFNVGGYCETSTSIFSSERSWDALRGLPICGMVAFVGDDALAYVSDKHLYVTNHLGKQLFRQSVPAPDGVSLPFFSGISDDNSRIAIKAWKSRLFGKGALSDYEEVFVYDLLSHKRLLSRAIPGGAASALSPDGKQLATIEDSVLVLSSVP